MKTLRIKSINGNTSFQDIILQVTEKVVRKYILVSGINYQTGYSFIKYCNDYKVKIEKRDKDSQIIIVDILGGNITTYERGKKIKNTKYDTISKEKNYNGKRFSYDLGKKNYITKQVIYNLICEIGENEPNTLEDVSVFSHSYAFGPILANSYETDMFDLDMRINDLTNKIFNFLHFKDAFTDTGIFKIWGCNMSLLLNNFIKQIMKNLNYKKDGTTKDEIIFIVKDNSFIDDKISDLIKDKFRSNVKNGKFEMTMLQIRKFLADRYYQNFAGLLSYYTDVSVLSALPGTYSSFSSPNYFRISDKTKENINIFEKYLQIQIGELNYGMYDKNTVSRLIKFSN